MGGLSNGSIPTPCTQTEGLQIGDHRLSSSVGSLNGPINIVVVTLFNHFLNGCHSEL